VELKTGYHVERLAGHWRLSRLHGDWSWHDVWSHLPDEASTLVFLPACVVGFVVLELWCRFRERT
jgi:hypothetical protein